MGGWLVVFSSHSQRREATLAECNQAQTLHWAPTNNDRVCGLHFISGLNRFRARCSSWCDASSDRSFMGCTHWAMSRSSQCSTTGVTKAVVCYPVCGMMHIKEPLLLIEKSSLCGGSGFPPSLSEWFFTICLTPYNRK